jgi:hypothetical protein
MDQRTDGPDVAEIRNRLMARMGEHAGAYPVHLEQQFPRILAKIADLWGSAALDHFLDDLMLPDRQDRQGFPAGVATELFRLAGLHSGLNAGSSRGNSGWAAVEESGREKNVPGRD